MSLGQRSSALILGAIISSFMTSAQATELPLRRIMLSTGGVGYFEHEANVNGDATLSLNVRLDQVSDVLKSIVVFDSAGHLGRATLPGREPLAEMFRDLPFTLDDLASPAALLRALRGSSIRLTVNASILEGRIISVTDETTTTTDGRSTIVRHRITLLSPTGMRQALVEDASAIEIVDPNLKQQVDGALAAIAQNSEQDRRSLAIRVEGDGDRNVCVGYVVGAPLWKATYRLVLPNSDEKSQIEGFALLENMSGQDWSGVDLTVASGNPVTFRQALYEAYYVDRPEVPIDVLGRILPPMDTGAVAPPANAASPSSFTMFLHRSAGQPASIETISEPTPSTADGVTPTDVDQGQTQVTFHFPQPVDLARGQAMLAPIVNQQMQAERVSVFRRDVDKTNPVAAVRLQNDSDTSLPPGAVTMYEAQGSSGDLSFVGDARMGPLPKGQDRLLEFAADLDMQVTTDDKYAQTIAGGAIDRGVFVVRRVEQRTTTYQIAGAKDEARRLIIEHPRIEGFDLVAPTDGRLGQTPTHYRLQVDVPMGQTMQLDVTLQRPIEQRFSIVGMSLSDLGVYFGAANIPAEVQNTLKQIAALQRTLADRQEGLKALQTDRDTQVEDQARLRANLAAVGSDNDLRSRYLTALGAAEDRITALEQSIATARDAVNVARDELEKFIGSLSM